MGGSPTSLSLAVVEAIAEREGVEAIDLDRPLYDVVDPDALENLFPRDAGGEPRCRGHVTFAYGRHTVRVASDGEVRIRGPSVGDSTAPAGEVD